MSPRVTRTSVTRAVLLLGFALAVVWATRSRRPAAETSHAAAVSAGPEFAAVHRLVFTSGGDSLVVARRGEAYWILHPFHDRADPLLVEEVRRQARSIAALRVLPDEVGPAFGLTPPRRRVAITDADGRLWSLRIGDPTPVGGQVYGALDGAGAPVVVLDEFTVGKFFAPADFTLRDPVPAPLRAGPPDSIEVRAGARSLRARRLGAERWVAREPAGLELDPLRINQVVQQLRGPNLIGFPRPPGDPIEHGLDAPRVIWILHQGDRAETVTVGRATPDGRGVYVRPSGRTLPAILGSDYFRQLVDGWPGLADRHLVRIVAGEIDTVSLLAPRPGGSYRRSAEGWVRDPGAVPADAAMIERDVAALAALQWLRWPDSPDRPAGPFLTLRLAGGGSAETLSLAGGDTTGWARRGALPLWGPVSRLVWQTWEYRFREVR